MTEISYTSIARKKKLIRGLGLATLVAAGAAIAFISNQETSPEQVTPNKSNTLSISGPWEVSSLDPSKQGYMLIRMQVMETLLNVDGKGIITPGLATKWQRSEDGLTWRFTLRDNVMFHDGSKLDAASVVRSLAFAQRKHGTLNKAEVRSISALNENEIEIELSKPYAAFASLLTNYANVILAPASYEPNGAIKTLYGTGPYQMESFAPPHKFTVKKFDGYWGDEAKINFATYLTGHRAESRLLQAKSGEADIVFNLEPSMLGQLKSGSEVNVHSDLIPRTMFVKVNAGHPFLKEARARKALSMAIDRVSIAKNVLGVPGSETTQVIPSSMSQWFIEDAKNSDFNLEQARSTLAELGWERGENGTLERNRVPFKLTMITYADRPELTTVATAIQAQWAKLGVELKVDVTNSSMIPASHQDGSLQLALIARNFGINADPLPIISSDFANGGGDWGTMNWSNAMVDGAIAELLHSQDKERAFELSQQVAKEIYQDTPVIAISSYSQHTSVNKRVKNFKFDPFERNYFINQMEIN